MSKHATYLLFSCLYIVPASLWAAAPASKHPLIADHSNPKRYIIETIQVKGAFTLDPEVVIASSGLRQGEVIQVPGKSIDEAIHKLCKQKLVDNVSVYAYLTSDDHVELVLQITEKQRLAEYTIDGVGDLDQDKIAEKAGLLKGIAVTEQFLHHLEKTIKHHFEQEGHNNVNITFIQTPSLSLPGYVSLKIEVNKGPTTHVKKLIVEGNQFINTATIKQYLAKTRENKRTTFVREWLTDLIMLRPIKKGGIIWRRLTKQQLIGHISHIASTISTPAFTYKDFEEDKSRLKHVYSFKGFRDIAIAEEVIQKNSDQSVSIYLKLVEGKRYFVRKIIWVGNSVYDEVFLSRKLGVVSGDPYSPELMGMKTFFGPQEAYRNKGYLTCRIEPVEARVEGNQVDIEMRITEGNQAYINKVLISGNKYTHEHVIRRSLRLVPGDKFDMDNLRRSEEEISRLDITEANGITIEPINLSADGSRADIECTVKEKVNLGVQANAGTSAEGWQFSASFNMKNASIRNLFRPSKWHPLPLGDGQTLDLSVTHIPNGVTEAAISFTDPWMWGKRPTSFDTSIHCAKRSDEKLADKKPSYCVTGGIGFGLGRKVAWANHTKVSFVASLNRTVYSNYHLLDTESDAVLKNQNKQENKKTKRSSLSRESGDYTEIVLKTVIERKSTVEEVFPRKGSILRLQASFTPPYSLFINRQNNSLKERIKLVEYHQWLFDAVYFKTLFGDLVASVGVHCGILGQYSPRHPVGPHGRFIMGGGPLGGASEAIGQEHIPLRGYKDDEESLKPETLEDGYVYQGGRLYNKIGVELRYPVLLSGPVAIYVLGFCEAGNNWNLLNKFQVKEMLNYPSIGFGLRALLPMFGWLGIDIGYGLNKKGTKARLKPEVHFGLNRQLSLH